MKQAEHKISDASFTGHYFKLLVIRLKQFKTAKHVVLIVIVSVCILARYVVLSADKNLTKPQSAIDRYQKVKSDVPKYLFKNAVWQEQNVSKPSQQKLNPIQKDDQYFFVNEAP